MDLNEAIYGIMCRSPIRWFELFEARFIGPYLVYQAMDNVNLNQEKMSQSHQKSFTNIRRRTLQFQVDDWVIYEFRP